MEGGKRSTFYSVTSKSDTESGWTIEDLRIVRCLLSKHVVVATYDDAVKRRVMTGAKAKEECLAIIEMYDAMIAKHLLSGEP